MTQSSELSEIDAIKQVIAEGGAMDYIDVVDAVEKRFRIKTSSAKVEEVHHDLVDAAKTSEANEQHFTPGLGVSMTSKLPSEPELPATKSDIADDHLTLAMQFVKSVGGLKQAKRALVELEAMLRN